jgi:two-component system LytT family response regulator
LYPLILRGRRLSNPVRILVVDDEELARRKICRFIGDFGGEFIVSEAANGLEAIDHVNSFCPQIVFLDIQMPGLNGFEFLYHVDARQFHVIFQTAHDQYAIKAFEENACDYLLKPFSRERFDKAFSRVLKKLPSNAMFSNEVVETRVDFHDHNLVLSKMVVKSAGIRLVLDVSDVDCFMAKDHYCCIYVGTKEYLCEMSLSKLEDRLDSKTFIRIHRSSIINVNSVKTLSGPAQNEVLLKNSMKVIVSRRSRGALIQLLKTNQISRYR